MASVLPTESKLPKCTGHGGPYVPKMPSRLETLRKNKFHSSSSHWSVSGRASQRSTFSTYEHSDDVCMDGEDEKHPPHYLQPQPAAPPERSSSTSSIITRHYVPMTSRGYPDYLNSKTINLRAKNHTSPPSRRVYNDNLQKITAGEKLTSSLSSTSSSLKARVGYERSHSSGSNRSSSTTSISSGSSNGNHSGKKAHSRHASSKNRHKLEDALSPTGVDTLNSPVLISTSHIVDGKKSTTATIASDLKTVDLEKELLVENSSGHDENNVGVLTKPLDIDMASVYKDKTIEGFWEALPPTLDIKTQSPHVLAAKGSENTMKRDRWRESMSVPRSPPVSPPPVSPSTFVLRRGKNGMSNDEYEEKVFSWLHSLDSMHQTDQPARVRRASYDFEALDNDEEPSKENVNNLKILIPGSNVESTNSRRLSYDYNEDEADDSKLRIRITTPSRQNRYYRRKLRRRSSSGNPSPRVPPSPLPSRSKTNTIATITTHNIENKHSQSASNNDRNDNELYVSQEVKDAVEVRAIELENRLADIGLKMIAPIRVRSKGSERNACIDGMDLSIINNIDEDEEKGSEADEIDDDQTMNLSPLSEQNNTRLSEASEDDDSIFCPFRRQCDGVEDAGKEYITVENITVEKGCNYKEDTEELLSYIDMLSASNAEGGMYEHVDISDVEASIHHTFYEHVDVDENEDENGGIDKLNEHVPISPRTLSFVCKNETRKEPLEQLLKGPRLRNRLELGQRRMDVYSSNQKSFAFVSYSCIWFFTAVFFCVLYISNCFHNQNNLISNVIGRHLNKPVISSTSASWFLPNGQDPGMTSGPDATIKRGERRHQKKDQQPKHILSRSSVVSKVKSATHGLYSFSKSHSPKILFLMNVLSAGYGLKNFSPIVSDWIKKQKLIQMLQLLQNRKEI